jgi:hypothetical protein
MAMRSVVPRLRTIPVAWMPLCFVRVTPFMKRHEIRSNRSLIVTKAQQSVVGSIVTSERTR